MLLVVSEGANLLLPLLPINAVLCKRIQIETYKETGLWFSTQRMTLQWHLWEGITVKLHQLHLVPEKQPKTPALWDVQAKELTLGVNVFNLVLHQGNGAISQLTLDELSTTVQGTPGLDELQAVLKKIAEKPAPPNAPRWIQSLQFSADGATFQFVPTKVTVKPLELTFPKLTGHFKQAQKKDPFDLTIDDLTASLQDLSKLRKLAVKPLATLSVNGEFSLLPKDKNQPVATHLQTLWQGITPLKHLNFTTDIPDVSALIHRLHQDGLLSNNPIRPLARLERWEQIQGMRNGEPQVYTDVHEDSSTANDTEDAPDIESCKRSIKKGGTLPKQLHAVGEVKNPNPAQWELALSGFNTLTAQPPSAKVNWQTQVTLSKQPNSQGLLSLKMLQLNHATSKATLLAKGSTLLTEESFKTFNQQPFSIEASGGLPAVTALPPSFKQVIVPATASTQRLQLSLLKGGVILQKLKLTGTLKTPVIQQLEAQLNHLKMQAFTAKRSSPIVQTSGRIAWLAGGKVKGLFTVAPHETLFSPPATITLARTLKTQPIHLQLQVPALEGAVVSAWQPWVLEAIAPALRKAPAYQWQALSWRGKTSFNAKATYQPNTQKLTLLNADGSLNRWQASLQQKPWMVSNGNWHWQANTGISPTLQLALANSPNTPWLSVRGRWHPQQASSVITITANKHAVPILVKQGFQPINEQFLPPAMRISQQALNQWLSDPTLQPWLNATASAQATFSPQQLKVHALNLDGLAQTGNATLQATVPWQAFSSHTTKATASLHWQKIPLEPITFGFKKVLNQADLQLKKLTGTTNGALSWQGAFPKTILPEDFNSPNRLAWLRPLTGDIDLSPIEGQWQQHPIPFKLDALKLHLSQLALSHQSPLKLDWGTASVAGQVGVHPTEQNHWQPTVNLALAPIPLETLKTEHLFYEPFFAHLKLEYPTFWRTAGTVAGDIQWDSSSNAPMAQLHLANAGFYMPRTFAPLHGVTGTFKVDILKHALSLPNPLFVQLGNSTVLIPWLNLKNTGNQWQLGLQAQGRLHPRELNSLLGNNWYFQPTQYPWLADSWLGLNALWGGTIDHPKSSIEANLSSVLQSEGKIATQTESPLAEEATAKALVMQLAETEKPPALNPTVTPTLSVLSPSKLASLQQKSQLNRSGISKGVPKLVTFVESAGIGSQQEVVWYQKAEGNQPAKELARYPLSMGNQPLATLALQFKGSLNQPRLDLGELRLLGRSEPLRFQATLDAPTQPTHLWSSQGRIWTEDPIQLDALASHTNNPAFRFESGSAATNLHWQQADTNPIGQIQLKAIQSAGLGLDNLEADAQFKAAQLNLSIPQFQAGGSDVALTGTALLPQPLPIAFDNLDVTGKTFYVEGFLGLLDKLTTTVIKSYKQGLPPTVRWVPERTISLPIQVEAGTITLDEAIVNNILATNYTSQWRLFPNGYLALDDMNMAVAGGTVKGQLSVSPSQRNTISLKIDADHVKANALARALLNAPNQVFGDLTGGIDFATYGFTPVTLIQHANGKASFVIAEGRVPALDKVERLLSTANVVRGGVLGFNLNNLAFAIKGGLKAGAIRAISGDFQVVDGQLLTRNFLSDSKNLDLAMSGGVRLDNGLADLVIIGIMPQNVESKGFLGKLGGFSLGKVINYVPVLGYIPLKGGSKKGVFDYIPGLGYVPGLGGVPGKTNSFEALLKGPPDDPTSIKSIRWLRQEKVAEPVKP